MAMPLVYATTWRRADEGGLDDIRKWIDAHPQARLIIVEMLARFRAPPSRGQSAYEADYAAIAGLQALAGEKGLAIVVVHHLRKSGSDSEDPFDKVSGTLGLSGAADTMLVLDRDGMGCVLYARGRDVEEIETAIGGAARSRNREGCARRLGQLASATAAGAGGRQGRRRKRRRSIGDARTATWNASGGAVQAAVGPEHRSEGARCGVGSARLHVGGDS
jgi:AAA domain